MLYDGLGVPDVRPIDDFLDDDGEDDGTVRVQTEGNSSCWEIEHSRVFVEHDLEWPVPSEVLATTIGTVHYNRREVELVFFYDYLRPLTDADPEEAIVQAVLAQQRSSQDSRAFLQRGGSRFCPAASSVNNTWICGFEKSPTLTCGQK